MAPTFFVTGATGHQGGAVTRYLISKHVTVHALIRDPSSPSARLLKKLGVVIFPGDFDDITAITTACEGITGIFLNTTFFPSLASLELMHAKNIINAASAAGAKTIVYSSMLLVGKLESFPPWPPDSSLEAFYESKWEIEESVRRSGIRYWTVLRPAFLMQNFLPPVSRSFFPELAGLKHLTRICFLSFQSHYKFLSLTTFLSLSLSPSFPTLDLTYLFHLLNPPCLPPLSPYRPLTLKHLPLLPVKIPRLLHHRLS